MKITDDLKQEIWAWLMDYKAGKRDDVGRYAITPNATVYVTAVFNRESAPLEIFVKCVLKRNPWIVIIPFNTFFSDSLKTIDLRNGAFGNY